MQSVNKIKEDFKKVIKYSQGIENPQVDELFDRWLEAKREFIEIWGGNFIYEYPEKVHFELDAKERHSRLQQFISAIEYKWDNYALARFVDNMQEGFFNNLTIADYDIGNKKIKKGTKLVKAFKYFVDDERALADIQNEASRIIQEDKIEGTLCFSVHPLDFISSSENTYNWRSCHALDGEYRSGNLSYMVDDSTIICYLRADKKETFLPNFPNDVLWNSKKWRVLLFFSNDWNMLFAGRQYPFSTESGLKFIKDVVMPVSKLITGNYKWSDWHDDAITSIKYSNGEKFHIPSYIPVGIDLVKKSNLIVDEEDALHFNDLLNSSCYIPLYCYKTSTWSYFNAPTGETDETTRFKIGGHVNCLHCGKQRIKVSETMRCNECEATYGTLESDDFGYCSCCNRHFYLEDAVWVSDEVVCPQCAETELTRCEHCDSLYFNEDVTYHSSMNQYVCGYCAERYNRRNETSYTFY